MLTDQNRPLILVIDDEAELLVAVTTILTHAGYDCHCCSTAEAALEAARAKTPDLIISDINLQGRSGLELCRKIREDVILHDVPVMFLSGAQLPDIIRRSHAAGGTYYLRKPFDPEVLLELINKALWLPHLTRHHTARPTTVPTSATASY